MKNLYLLHLIILILFSNTSSFCQCWEEINLNVDSQIIPSLDNRRVYFINDSIGFVFSEKYIFKTKDAGITWKITHEEFLVGNSIHFINDSIGLYGTQSGLYKTVNKGESWEKISNFIDSATVFPLVQDIFYLDSLKAFAVGNDQMLLKTLDGGVNWQVLKSPTLVLSTPWDIDFIDEKHGFAGSRTNQFYKTSNGGETWSVVRFLSTEAGISNFEMLDTLNGIGIIGGGVLGFTNDGWESFELYPLSNYANRIFKGPNGVFWVAGTWTILKSQDFGGSWQNTLTQPNSVNFYDIHFSSIRNGWAVGPDYALWRYNPSPPNCVKELVSPENGGTDVSNLPDIVWSSVSNGCIEGYYISIGTSLDSMDLLNRHFVGLDTSFTPSFALPYDTEIYLKIEPFNTLHSASGCKDFYFRTEVCPEPVQTFIDTTLTNNQVFLGQLWEQDTTIRIKLRATNNCDSIIYFNINIDKSSIVKTSKDSVNIKVIPNPSNGYFTVLGGFDSPTKLQLEVRTLNNKIIFSRNDLILQKGADTSIFIPDLANGVYLIVLYNNKFNYADKLIISR